MRRKLILICVVLIVLTITVCGIKKGVSQSKNETKTEENVTDGETTTTEVTTEEAADTNSDAASERNNKTQNASQENPAKETQEKKAKEKAAQETQEKKAKEKAAQETQGKKTQEKAAQETQENTVQDQDELYPEIYSYLQGIKSYEKCLKWAGAWCEIEAGGQQFSSFGCGVCCLANMYSTKDQIAHDPSEVYEFALKNSDYNPDSGVGALSWCQINNITEAMGISATLERKPADYSDFVEMVSNNKTLLVLVSSQEDDALWTNVPGHYVNIWEYDSKTDLVFLTDSKGPKNNRTMVKLEDVYNALKTSSDYQIMCCEW